MPLWLWCLALLPFVLACWQWQRGETRSLAQQRFAAAAHAPAVALPAQGGEPDYRRVRVSGRAVGEPLWLANAWLGERPGLRQLQPFRLDDGSFVLVELGWQPESAPRRTIPPVAGALTGRWMPFPARFTLPGARLAARGVVDALDPGALAALGQPWRAGVITLDVAPAPLRAWPTALPFDPQRNYAYALQWLLIGLCLVIGCFVLGRRRHERA